MLDPLLIGTWTKVSKNLTHLRHSV